LERIKLFELLIYNMPRNPANSSRGHDVFSGKRRTDRGTKARPGEQLINRVVTRTIQSARAVEFSAAQKKKVFVRLDKHQKVVAEQLLRIVKRSKKIDDWNLIDSTLAMLSTKGAKYSEKIGGQVVEISLTREHVWRVLRMLKSEGLIKETNRLVKKQRD